MKIKLQSSILILALVLVVGWLSSHQVVGDPDNGKIAGQNEQRSLGQLAKLNELSEKERIVLLRDDYQNLSTTWDILMGHLGNTNSEVRCYAAYLLGQRRISDAAPALAQMITLEAAFRDNPREWFWGKYPAVEALIKIGDPAITDVLRNLQESNDAKVRELSMRVIYHIDRKDKGFVRLRLEKALAVQDNTEKKARLQTALRFLQVSDFRG